jgi:hypothetical protein
MSVSTPKDHWRAPRGCPRTGARRGAEFLHPHLNPDCLPREGKEGHSTPWWWGFAQPALTMTVPILGPMLAAVATAAAAKRASERIFLENVSQPLDFPGFPIPTKYLHHPPLSHNGGHGGAVASLSLRGSRGARNRLRTGQGAGAPKPPPSLPQPRSSYAPSSRRRGPRGARGPRLAPPRGHRAAARVRHGELEPPPAPGEAGGVPVLLPHPPGADDCGGGGLARAPRRAAAAAAVRGRVGPALRPAALRPAAAAARSCHRRRRCRRRCIRLTRGLRLRVPGVRLGAPLRTHSHALARGVRCNLAGGGGGGGGDGGGGDWGVWRRGRRPLLLPPRLLRRLRPLVVGCAPLPSRRVAAARPR